jgi:hypothetical protein
MALPAIDNLMKKEMDRREFLVAVGTIAAGVFGISRLLSQVEQVGGRKEKAPARSGYGASPYGR